MRLVALRSFPRGRQIGTIYPLQTTCTQMREELSRRLESGGREEGLPTEAEVRAVFEQWLAEKPEARELTERLAIFLRFRGTSQREDV